MTASDEHLLGPGLLPTPFTAAEIRAASRGGKTIHLLVESPDGTSFERVNRFRDGDDDGATLEQWTTDAPAAVTSRRVTWRELQKHAAFPADATRMSTEVLDLPLGRLECLRYDRQAAEGEPPATFWFALAHPGMPVRFEAGGQRTTVLSIRAD
ncbi:hypothetical protein [Microbacterium sp.]|uniref:hypothetical protein n=1 Tax=Microbacterium sp. TaxID=51671 RepID=UPI0028120514|nr:hypothetical protein [Microbacterium sp.]